MNHKYWSFFLLICYHSVGCKKSDEDSTFSTNSNLLLQHAFGPDDAFANRGSITFKSSKGSSASITDDVELSSTDMQKLRNLVAEDGLYFIRSPTKIGGSFVDAEKNRTSYVSTFVKACYLYGSDLQEAITVSIDYAGNVIGLSIVSPRSDCTHVNKKMGSTLNSTIFIQHQVPGAVPDTQTFIKKVEQEKAEEAAGKGKDNRSFLAKYWMYILPVFIILMLSSQAEPPAEGGGE